VAGVYHSQGRYTEAEKLYNRVLRSQKQQLGSDHVKVLTTMNNLALLYVSQGRHAEAEKLSNQVLHGREQQLGCGHISVLVTKRGLAVVYRRTHRYRQAEALINEVLTYQQVQFGPHDFRTFWTMHQLACIYRDQRKHEETEELFRRILLGGTENRSGPEHAQTVANIQVWVSNCHIHGLHEEVEATLLEVLAFREKILGPHHPHTRETIQMLAILYKNLDQPQDIRAITLRLEQSRSQIVHVSHLLSCFCLLHVDFF
jgi:tetratricopeptide (TPR) repeat protein